MKKKLLFLFSIFFCAHFSFAQNLVPNPSFEDTLNCPTSTAQVYNAANWENYGQTPDYFNSCNHSFVTVPHNCFTYQFAAHGNAYCGLICYQDFDSTYREFLGAQLVNSLIPGNKYYVSLKINLSNGFGICRYGIDKFGIRFSTIPYNQLNPPPIDNYEQIVSNVMITDTANWYFLKRSFIADSAYQFIILGNFFKSYLTDTVRMPGQVGPDAYYLVDDVCVSLDSNSCYSNEAFNIIENPLNEIQFYNSGNEIFLKNLSNHYLEFSRVFITNTLGEILNTYQFNLDHTQQINISSLPSSIYFLTLQTKNQIQTFKFIKP